ncbi:hypothetical protein [Clostridium sp. DJ247]|uniref:hypothetical protein n=1 Tax=Clostridium sp. DJ247 TaxID=2726188 RepID=UPI00162AB2C5|nr:hypothetical protein [Clostridium sp. DJ247]MBC2579406.1 hypothetical protein [Clostridium sp. DJ247]
MIYEIISKYHLLSVRDKHHRFKSWEHCNNFFIKHKGNLADENLFDYSCLHLAFYLASWGMMRGGTFLLQKDYRIHEYFIRDVAMNDKYKKYYSSMQVAPIDEGDIDGLNDLIEDTIKVYVGNIKEINGIETTVSVTDTLVSKILLGIYGIVPAYDRFFINAVKSHGFKNTALCENSIKDLVSFYYDFENEFEKCRMLFEKDGVKYPPMKLIDMYFWQVGYMVENPEEFSEDELQGVCEFANQYSQKIREANKFKTREKLVSTSNNQDRATGLKEEISSYINSLLASSLEKGLLVLEISSGNIHKAMNLKNRIPSVCNAMLSVKDYKYEIIKDTASGMSSTKTIRYYLK